MTAAPALACFAMVLRDGGLRDPVIGAVACASLASPLSGRAAADYRIAAVLTAIGVGLWAVTSAVQRWVLHEDVEPDPARLEAPAP